MGLKWAPSPEKNHVYIHIHRCWCISEGINPGSIKFSLQYCTPGFDQTYLYTLACHTHTHTLTLPATHLGMFVLGDPPKWPNGFLPLVSPAKQGYPSPQKPWQAHLDEWNSRIIPKQSASPPKQKQDINPQKASKARKATDKNHTAIPADADASRTHTHTHLPSSLRVRGSAASCRCPSAARCPF